VALDALLRRLGVEVAPFDDKAAALARLAYGRFGKGIGSPGVLNLGDRLTYGTAMTLREPFLSKGDSSPGTRPPSHQFIYRSNLMDWAYQRGSQKGVPPVGWRALICQ
jgi:hypothetical protein